MKANLSFNLPEETEEFKDAFNGSKYRCAFDEVWEKGFRPYYKHGYSDDELNKLIDEHPNGEKIMEKLADIYREIKREIEE